MRDPASWIRRAVPSGFFGFSLAGIRSARPRKRNVPDAPGDQRFVGVGPVLLGAFLDDRQSRLGTRKRGRLKIEWPPIPILDVLVVAAPRERCHEEISNPR